MCITSITSASTKLRLMPTVVCLAMWKKNKIQYYQARASHQLGVALQISNSSTVQVTILNEPVLKPNCLQWPEAARSWGSITACGPSFSKRANRLDGSLIQPKVIAIARHPCWAC